MLSMAGTTDPLYRSDGSSMGPREYTPKVPSDVRVSISMSTLASAALPPIPPSLPASPPPLLPRSPL